MERKSNSLRELLDSKTVCEWLGIPQSRLYTLVSTAEFPVIKISTRRLRFEVNEILKWINSRKQGGVR